MFSNRNAFRFWLAPLSLYLALISLADQALANANLSRASEPVSRQEDGVIMPTHGGYLKLQVCAPTVVRVAFSKKLKFFNQPSFSVLPKVWPHEKWSFTYGNAASYLDTSQLVVKVNMANGQVLFYDKSNRLILSEAPNGRTLDPAVVQGENTFSVQQKWLPSVGESLYGLGQHQLGLMDIKGYDIELWQHNGTVSIPMLVSSKGYGIFWDNPSYTKFGDVRSWEAIPANILVGSDGKIGALSVSYFSGSQFGKLLSHGDDSKLDIEPPAPRIRRPNPPTTPGASPSAASPRPRLDPNALIPGTPLPYGNASVRWEGFIAPNQSGDYKLESFYNGGLKVWIDGKLVMNHWRQSWLPWIDEVKIPMTAGKRYAIRMEWTKDDGANVCRLQWKTPSPDKDTSLWSQVANGTDYYFIYGPKVDDVVSGYRFITGKATLMPRWAFGLWQSRQRYETQQESLDVVDGYRQRQIPFDNIVQDWFYWPANAWGSHQFDPVRFPDPNSWINSIHAQHAHLMISVWPKFYPGTDNFNALNSHGFLYQPNLKEGIHDWVGYPDTFYDAFNPDARKMYWQQMKTALFDKGVDAWWMDASEPDMLPLPTLDGTLSHMTPTALGPASRVLNAFPLENSKAVYEGQRSAAPNQRVFILTRSAYAGQQRYAASTWSGDITSTWTAMRKQITAGLGFSISGMPYWTMDCGGFSVPSRFASRQATDADVAEWRELNARWFEFATFVPLLRVHGEVPYREMWQFGGEDSPTYQAELKFDKIRYALFPYIYSVAGAVTHDNYTFMRPLVMDFQNDTAARNIADQYMFGPAFLVNPVTTYQAKSRSVYLPQSSGWYDFWTGVKISGGQTIDAAAPFDHIPIYIKAGSIIPVGPQVQYIAEKKSDPITLYVYEGADASFSLYEDDGLTYGYERGEYTTIPITWNEREKLLTIGVRKGNFPGMLKERRFKIVFVSKDRPIAFNFNQSGDKMVTYNGSFLDIRRLRP